MSTATRSSTRRSKHLAPSMSTQDKNQRMLAQVSVSDASKNAERTASLALMEEFLNVDMLEPSPVTIQTPALQDDDKVMVSITGVTTPDYESEWERLPPGDTFGVDPQWIFGNPMEYIAEEPSLTFADVQGLPGAMTRASSSDTSAPSMDPNGLIRKPNTLLPLKASTDALLPTVDLTPDVLNAMPSHQRRQIRNKLSARQFRARKKEYMEELERNVSQLSVQLEEERTRRMELEGENVRLRGTVEGYRRRFGDLRDVAEEMDIIEQDVQQQPTTPLYVDPVAEKLGYEHGGSSKQKYLVPTAADIHKDGLFGRSFLGHPDVAEPWMQSYNMLVGQALVIPGAAMSSSMPVKPSLNDATVYQLGHFLVSCAASMLDDMMHQTECALVHDPVPVIRPSERAYVSPLQPMYPTVPSPSTNKTEHDVKSCMRAWLQELCEMGDTHPTM